MGIWIIISVAVVVSATVFILVFIICKKKKANAQMSAVPPENILVPNMTAQPENSVDASQMDLTELRKFETDTVKHFKEKTFALLTAMGFFGLSELQDQSILPRIGFDIIGNKADKGEVRKYLIYIRREPGRSSDIPLRTMSGMLYTIGLSRGLYITTSQFSSAAINYASSTGKIDIIDGIVLNELLARLLSIAKITNVSE